MPKKSYNKIIVNLNEVSYFSSVLEVFSIEKLSSKTILPETIV